MADRNGKKEKYMRRICCVSYGRRITKWKRRMNNKTLGVCEAALFDLDLA